MWDAVIEGEQGRKYYEVVAVVARRDNVQKRPRDSFWITLREFTSIAEVGRLRLASSCITP